MKTSIKKTALFSLYDRDQAVLYARQLISLGWKIVATRETYRLLAKNGIRALEISEYLGIKTRYPFPPTLHPEMELALTTNKGKTIDLVYDTTYPLSRGMDVGGHTLLALAAKGNRIVAANKQDLAEVISELENNHNEISPVLRQRLVGKAFQTVAKFYASLGDEFPGQALKISPLLNGENPYQIPADIFYIDRRDPLALGKFKQVSGELPCYTNIADFDSILKIMCLACAAFNKQYAKIPYVAIASKHGNPCGFSIDWKSPAETLENALWQNPVAIWGGEVITNFAISKEIAQKLLTSPKRYKLLGSPAWLLDLIVAPDFSNEAVKILGKNPRRKLFQNIALSHPQLNSKAWFYRMVRGGYLRQPPHNYILDFSDCIIDFPLPGDEVLDSLIIAWATAWFSSLGGNEVAIAKDRKLIAAGGGPSTLEASKFAVLRAKQHSHSLKNCVFAANAFFPFIDGPRELIKAGCTYGVVPDGGKNQESVKRIFKNSHVNVFYLPEQFRGFSRH